MTVPRCTENTKWIVSTNKLRVSEAQLEMLRTLKTNDHDVDYLRDNFRPLQQLNGRQISLRTSPPTTTTTMTTTTVTATTAITTSITTATTTSTTTTKTTTTTPTPSIQDVVSSELSSVTSTQSQLDSILADTNGMSSETVAALTDLDTTLSNLQASLNSQLSLLSNVGPQKRSSGMYLMDSCTNEMLCMHNGTHSKGKYVNFSCFRLLNV